jgi:hypothetical protein
MSTTHRASRDNGMPDEDDTDQFYRAVKWLPVRNAVYLALRDLGLSPDDRDACRPTTRSATFNGQLSRVDVAVEILGSLRRRGLEVGDHERALVGRMVFGACHRAERGAT